MPQLPDILNPGSDTDFFSETQGVIFASFNEIFNDHFLTDPDITAHRGASNLAPENTLAALQKGIDVGADYAEIDVAQTQATINQMTAPREMIECINNFIFEDLIFKLRSKIALHQLETVYFKNKNISIETLHSQTTKWTAKSKLCIPLCY